MKEKVLMEVGSVAGKGELTLTDRRVILRKGHVVTYEDETREIPLEKVAGADVREMDISASFVFNWMGIEMALLLIFFGLTSASVPLYNVYLTFTGSFGPNFFGHMGRLILSLLMVWLGIVMIPWFDGVIIRIKSTDGKTIRYLKNIMFRRQLEKFRFLLVQEVQKLKKK